MFQTKFFTKSLFIASALSMAFLVIIPHAQAQYVEYQTLQHNAAIWTTAFSPNGKIFASGSADGVIKIWSLQEDSDEWIEVQTLTNHQSGILRVVFNADNNKLVSLSRINAQTALVIIFSLNNGQWIAESTNRTQNVFDNLEVRKWAHSPDRKTFAQATENKIDDTGEITGENAVIIYAAENDQLIKKQILNDPEDDELVTYSLAFSPNGGTLACGSEDSKSIRMWSLQPDGFWKKVQRLRGHSDSVNTVAFSPDGKTFASGSEDCTIKIWVPITMTKSASSTITVALNNNMNPSKQEPEDSIENILGKRIDRPVIVSENPKKPKFEQPQEQSDEEDASSSESTQTTDVL